MKKPNSCFLHIPKSGGSALERHLATILGRPNVFHTWGSARLNTPLEILVTRYPVVAGHFSFAEVTDALLNTTFVFTFLRDPVERILSLYYFLRESELGPAGDPFGDLVRTKAKSLPDLLADLPKPMRPTAWSNDQTFLLSGAKGTEQPAEELLPAALRNLERLDFVGLHEDYDAGVRVLSELRGWPSTEAPPRVKVTADRPGREQVEPALLAEIQRFNECDLILYARARELWEDTKHRSARRASTVNPSIFGPLPERNIHAFSDHGSKKILITKAEVYGQRSNTLNFVEQGDYARIELSGHSAVTVDNVTIGIRLTDEIGLEVYGVNTQILGHNVSMTAGQSFHVVFTVDMILAQGAYYLTAAIHTGAGHEHECFHWLDNALVFGCRNTALPRFSGIADLKAHVASS